MIHFFLHFCALSPYSSSWSVRKITTSNSEENMTMFFLSRYFFANVSLSVNCEESGLWNIFFADALDSWIVWQTFPPLIIQAGSFEASQLLPSSHLIILNLLITLILMDLIILIPSVRGGVKLHIDVYWQPTVSNKKWDLLLEKAGTEYLFQIQAKTLPHGWPKLFASNSFPFEIS